MSSLLYALECNGPKLTAFPTSSSAACRLPAACIVNPKNAQEVSTVVKILSQTGTKFAVRSGGHNYIPGFASIDEGGVLISLSKLNSTELSGDKKTANIGPGNRWQAVYETLVPEGLIVIGGRVGPVGVGGLMLGGRSNMLVVADIFLPSRRLTSSRWAKLLRNPAWPCFRVCIKILRRHFQPLFLELPANFL